MFKRLSIILLITLVLLSGCSPASRQSIPPASPGSSARAPEMESAPDQSKDSYGTGSSSANGAVPAEAPAAEPTAGPQSSGEGVKRMVIRNANLTIVVTDPGTAMDEIARMADSMGGFTVSSNLYKTTTKDSIEVPEANIQIRVPAERLNEAMSQIKKLVKDSDHDVLNENVSGQDVTKEFTDLSSRLKNLEQAEQQLREIMASANRTEDVLAVYQQLTQIREQIEVIRGQMQYYQEAAALSSIAVQLHAEAAVQPVEIAGWQPVGVARDAVQSLVDTMQFLGSAAIWLILYVLPVLLVIFIPLRLLWWFLRRNSKNRRPQAQTPPPAA